MHAQLTVVLALAILIPPTGAKEVSFYYSSERDDYLGKCEFVVRPAGGTKKYRLSFYDRAGTPRKPLSGTSPLDIEHTGRYRFEISRPDRGEHKYLYGSEHEFNLSGSVKTPKGGSVRNKKELELIGSRRGAEKAIKIVRDINKGRVTLTWPGASASWIIDYKNLNRERFGPAPEKTEGAGGEDGEKAGTEPAEVKSDAAEVTVTLESKEVVEAKVLPLVKGEKVSGNQSITFTSVDPKLAGTRFLQLPARTEMPYGISVTKDGPLWLLVHGRMKVKGLRGWRKTDLKVITGFGSLVVLQLDAVTGGGYKVLADKRMAPIVVASEIKVQK